MKQVKTKGPALTIEEQIAAEGERRFREAVKQAVIDLGSTSRAAQQLRLDIEQVEDIVKTA